MASFPKSTDTCWCAVDNIGVVSVAAANGSYVTATSPGSTVSAPTDKGDYYGLQVAASGTTTCCAAVAPTTATWGSTFSAA